MKIPCTTANFYFQRIIFLTSICFIYSYVSTIKMSNLCMTIMAIKQMFSVTLAMEKWP